MTRGSKVANPHQLKERGNQLFSQGKLKESVEEFTRAIEACTSQDDKESLLHILYSNRACAFTGLHKFAEALADANKCTQLKPTWAKGYFRCGNAMFGLRQLPAAVANFKLALMYDPENGDVKQALHIVQTAMQAMDDQMQASPIAKALAMLKEKGLQGPALPVTVLSGFLGSGKTTLLRHILHNQQGLRVAVIVNDMAELNIDAELVRGNLRQIDARLVELSNGCICCTLRDDLLTSVADILAEERFDYLVIESTGISEPMPVAATFSVADGMGNSLKDYTQLDTMVTVVDASRWLKDMREGPSLKDLKMEAGDGDTRSLAQLLTDQVEFADVILLNKVDLVSEEQVQELHQLLVSLNPGAKVLCTVKCELDLMEVLHTKRFNYEQAQSAAGWQQELIAGKQHTSETEEYGIKSFVYRATRPVHVGRLWAFMTSSKSLMGVLRSKGFVWLANTPELVWEWSTAGETRSFQPLGPWPESALKGDAAAASAEESNSKPVSDPAAGASTEDVHEGGRDQQGSPGTHSARSHSKIFSRRQQQVVFIGIKLEQSDIVRQMDACLLTDEEMLLGEEHWKEWPNPWFNGQSLVIEED